MPEDDPVAISMDGSAFDSTQHLSNKDAVETQFFQRLRPWLIDVFSHPDNCVNGYTPAEAADAYIAAASDHQQIVFAEVPGIDIPNWTPKEERMFKKYMRGDPRNYIPFTLGGTTFSGDPHTTLGNTLRMMTYTRFYLRHFS